MHLQLRVPPDAPSAQWATTVQYLRQRARSVPVDGPLTWAWLSEALSALHVQLDISAQAHLHLA